MTQRELAAKAGDDVPRDGQPGEEIGVDEDVQPEAIARSERQRHERNRESADEQYHRTVERGNASRGPNALSERDAAHDCSRKPTSSAPTWPKRPVGRTTSTARKMRNQIACL